MLTFPNMAMLQRELEVEVVNKLRWGCNTGGGDQQRKGKEGETTYAHIYGTKTLKGYKRW